MWSRISAGVLAGFFVAAGALGWIVWLCPGPWQATLVPALVAFFPAWTGVFCASLGFRSGARAWVWLGGLAVVLLATLWFAQHQLWVA